MEAAGRVNSLALHYRLRCASLPTRGAVFLTRGVCRLLHLSTALRPQTFQWEAMIPLHYRWSVRHVSDLDDPVGSRLHLGSARMFKRWEIGIHVDKEFSHEALPIASTLGEAFVYLIWGF